MAEVIAMDALTLLVHPENALDTYEVGKITSLKTVSALTASQIT